MRRRDFFKVVGAALVAPAALAKLAEPKPQWMMAIPVNPEKWHTRGIEAQLESNENEYDFGGALTIGKIEECAQSMSRYGPRERYVLASPTFMRKVDRLL